LDQAISEADLLAGDAYMKRFHYEIMTDAAQPGVPMRFGAVRRVYVVGKGIGPPILLLHELPGLRDGDIDLGARLGKMFEVTVPLMFGLPGQNNNGLGKRQACGTGLFDCKSTQAAHRIVSDLRPLVQRACGDADCGIIGMCLTGSLPLWLIPDAKVVALVLAQPSLPFPRLWSLFRRGIDISEADTAAAMKIAAQRHASIFMIRLHGDVISSHRSFELLKKRLRSAQGVALTCREDHGEVFEHSSLVWDDRHPKESGERFDALVAFLNARLRQSTPPRGDCQ
jgi:dienelactone hydrolase